jgi:beta,beta-carotene 9',10'-dioxygenase
MTVKQPDYFLPGFRQNQEEREIPSLPVHGDIPDWLEGSLIRNGPGMVQADKSMRHWFDGLAMLHKFTIRNKQVSYRSRFVDCEAYRATKETGNITYSDFATDPCRSLFAKVQTIFEKDPKITDSAKVNVGKIGEKVYALGEPLMQIQVDPETLRTLGVFHYDKNPGSRMTTAHPHTDKDEAYNLVVQYGPINYYKIYSIQHGVKEVASVPVREPAYLHSFGMSKRYFIIAEFPLVVQSLKFVFRLRPFIENFKWKGGNGTRFIIIDRKDGKRIATIKTDAFFSFHHVNAFEDGDDLVADLATYTDSAIINEYYINRLSETNKPLPVSRMERFVLDLKGKRIRNRKIISEACIELPHFDYAQYHGKSNYRYVYGCGIHPSRPNEFYNQLVKIDMQTGEHITWFGDGFYPGEPVFVPHPVRREEDDGILLSVVLNAAQNQSFLLILDARTLQERARAELSHAVLFGYHGLFINQAQSHLQ